MTRFPALYGLLVGPAPSQPDATLRAIAASGASGLSRKAQAELRQRTTERLRRELQS